MRLIQAQPGQTDPENHSAHMKDMHLGRRAARRPFRVCAHAEGCSCINPVEDFLSKLAVSVLHDIRVAAKQQLMDRLMAVDP